MKERKLYLLALFAFSFFTFLIFAPIFFGKVNLNGNLLVSFYAIYGENLPFKDTGWDQLRIYFPFYKITIDALRQFSLPFWNPYAFSGHPHLADFQTAVFYPLNVFGLFVSQITFWHILRITPTIFASFFTYLYLRNLKLGAIPSFFGALVFGFSPFIITWGEEVVMSPHSILYLPLILLAIDKLRDKFNRFYFVILSISLCLSVFAGYLQTTIYLLILSFSYFIYRGIFERLDFRFYFRTFIAFVLGLALSSVQLLPSAELFLNSQRLGVDFSASAKDFLLPPISLITFFAPDFFGNPATWNYFLKTGAHYYEAILFIGIAPLLFAFYSLVKKKNSFIVFFAIWAAVSLLTVVDTWFSRFFVSIPIPLVSTAIPHRILFVPAFAVAVVGSIGLDYWLSSKRLDILKSIFSFALLYLLILLYALKNSGYFAYKDSFVSGQIISLRNLVIPMSVFIFISFVLIFLRNKKIAVILIFWATAINIFYFSNKYLSFSKKQYIFPKNAVLDFIVANQGVDRTLFIGDTQFSTNFATQYSIFYPEGYDSLNNVNYSKFVYGQQNAPKEFIARRRSDAELGFRDNLQNALNNEKKRNMLNILGIKYIVANGDDRSLLLKYNDFTKVFENEQTSIYENTRALPRAFITPDWKEININRQDISAADKVDIFSYEPSRVRISTSESRSKYLVLTDNFYNGWKAKIDGKPVEILKPFSTFRAVKLDSDQNLVEFYYDSKIFKLGAVLSFAALILLGLIFVKKSPIKL